VIPNTRRNASTRSTVCIGATSRCVPRVNPFQVPGREGDARSILNAPLPARTALASDDASKPSGSLPEPAEVDELERLGS
jgi:hypothetical protein